MAENRLYIPPKPEEGLFEPKRPPVLPPDPKVPAAGVFVDAPNPDVAV